MNILLPVFFCLESLLTLMLKLVKQVFYEIQEIIWDNGKNIRLRLGDLDWNPGSAIH